MITTIYLVIFGDDDSVYTYDVDDDHTYNRRRNHLNRTDDK